MFSQHSISHPAWKSRLSLIDETGDVDWQRLDAKAAELVEQVFANCQLFNNPAR